MGTFVNNAKNRISVCKILNPKFVFCDKKERLRIRMAQLGINENSNNF